ncbi:MAG: hypothetical protein HKN43_04525 [Rhodothermales bacterium]|nr:hypothetical protein [Rhodothermales bacterium]
MDLIDEDFVEHFSATWIYADTVQAVNTAVWTRITTINDLLLWEAEWKQKSRQINGNSPMQFSIAATFLYEVAVSWKDLMLA